MNVTRRGFLASGTSLGLAAGTLGLGGCAALGAGSGPSARSLAPGVTRVALGSVTATTIHDGVISRPLDANFVRNAPLAAVQEALRSAGLPTDKLEVPYNPLVVDVGSQRVLFDAGNGEFGAPTNGKLMENMTRAGISATSITAVVFSHFHGDHINGLRNRAGAVVFPNAKIYTPAPEWDWWMDDARMAATPEAQRGGFAAVRRVFGPIAASVTRFQPGVEVLPGVRSMPAYGHTPGHTAFTFDGGAGNKLMYWGDTTNVGVLFARNPDWAVMFDMNADAARETRRRLAEQVIRDNMLLAGYHLAGSAIGRLTRLGNGYDFIPLVG